MSTLQWTSVGQHSDGVGQNAADGQSSASKKCRMAAATPAAVAAAGVTATLDGASATSIPSVIGPPSASVAPLSTGLPAALTASRRGTVTTPAVASTSTMNNFCLHWTPEQDSRFQESQARWMCATGLPFNVFDHPEFAIMVSRLNPAATPASAFVLRSRLLPTLYNKEREKLSELIRGRMVHLQADGVTDNVHESSFCVTAIVDGAAFFYGQFPNDGESQDAKYYAAKLQGVFNDIRDRGGSVASLTMDNTGTTTKSALNPCRHARV